MQRAHAAAAAAEQLHQRAAAASWQARLVCAATFGAVHRCRIARAQAASPTALPTRTPQCSPRPLPPLGWFAVEGLVAGEPVWALWDHGCLTGDHLLLDQASKLVDSQTSLAVGPGRQAVQASLSGASVAVLVTLLRALDVTHQLTVAPEPPDVASY